MMLYGEAKSAYEKFSKSEKGFFGFHFNKIKDKTELFNFAEIQKENGAYTSTYIGIRDIDIDKIKGSVQKYMDFNKNFVPKNEVLEERWCRIYTAFANGVSLPPVVLYKIKDDYFVYDGNHRISVAKFLDFKVIEAEVIEFLTSSDTKENVIYRQKFHFDKNTGIEDILLTETNQYDRLIKEIEDYGRYLIEKECLKLDFFEISKMWYDNVYIPVIEIIENNNILENFEERTISDIFIYFLDHKYFESEKKKHDAGFTYALVDFINFVKTYDDNDIENIFKIDNKNMDNLKKLSNIDRRKALDADILKKSDALKKVTGLELEHNFVMLSEIDEYIRKNKIENFEKGLEYWYSNVFKKSIETFKLKLKYLPKEYKEISLILLKNEENIFYSIENYSILYKKRIERESSFSEIIANYIVEIYIPIMYILKENKTDEEKIEKLYYGIQNRYNYLIEYKKEAAMKEAEELYFDSEDKIYNKASSWFFIKIGNSLKTNKAIENMINDFEKEIKEKSLFREILEKYGPIGKYTTIINIKKIIKFYEDINKKTNWIKDIFLQEIEKIKSQEEIVIYYKTKKIIEILSNEDSIFSLLDFYVEILDYSMYLGKDMFYVDIIDLAFEYKNR